METSFDSRGPPAAGKASVQFAQLFMVGHTVKRPTVSSASSGANRVKSVGSRLVVSELTCRGPVGLIAVDAVCEDGRIVTGNDFATQLFYATEA